MVCRSRGVSVSEGRVKNLCCIFSESKKKKGKTRKMGELLS